jgi:hypothetical protein
MRIFKFSLTAFSLISLMLWTGCTKDFSNIVEESSPVYTVNYVKPIPDSALTKNDTLSLEIGFSSTSKPSSVTVEFVTASQVEFSATLNQTSPSSNFIGNAVVSTTAPGGQYAVNYYITNNDGSTISIGKQSIRIIKWGNSAPVIDTVLADDTITVSSSTQIAYLYAKVSDADGLSDISQVYYNVVKPSGDTVGPYTLADDGTSPDQISGDGIFTSGLSIYSNAVKGTYRFDFQAKDKSGAVSTIKSHYMTLK